MPIRWTERHHLRTTGASQGPLQGPCLLRRSRTTARLLFRNACPPTTPRACGRRRGSTIARVDVDASEQYHAGPSGGARRRNRLAVTQTDYGDAPSNPPIGSRPYLRALFNLSRSSR